MTIDDNRKIDVVSKYIAQMYMYTYPVTGFQFNKVCICIGFLIRLIEFLFIYIQRDKIYQ